MRHYRAPFPRPPPCDGLLAYLRILVFVFRGRPLFVFPRGFPFRRVCIPPCVYCSARRCLVVRVAPMEPNGACCHTLDMRKQDWCQNTCRGGQLTSGQSGGLKASEMFSLTGHCRLSECVQVCVHERRMIRICEIRPLSPSARSGGTVRLTQRAPPLTSLIRHSCCSPTPSGR